MKITVHKCPWTGKLFEEPKKYRKHLKEQRLIQQHRREKARLKVIFKEFVAPIYEMINTDLIAEWLTENYPKIFLHYGPGFRSSHLKNPRFESGDKVIFRIFDGTYSERCSTTHNAPLGQKTTGWGNAHIPENGWKCRIELTFEGRGYQLVDTDHLKYIGINTGTGGGGDEHLEYDMTLFTKDFHGLRKLAQLDHLIRLDNRRGYYSDGKEILAPEKNRYW